MHVFFCFIFLYGNKNHRKEKEMEGKRKIQYCEDGVLCHSYVLDGGKTFNPCGCGSNVYHLEYDGKTIFGVCNACGKDIYEVKPVYIPQKLNEGIWK